MKAWYTSKTINLNALVGMLALLEANTGVLAPLLPSNWLTMLSVGLPVVNIVLRAITTKGVSK